MRIIYFIIAFMTNLILFSQADTVLLNVSVLGQPYPNTTYHPPIEGKYLIKNLDKKELSKKQLEIFKGFEFIDPTANFKTGTNRVQANSLRHYIDTDELFYLQWNNNDYKKNDSIVQKFIDSSKNIRRNKYQSLVQNYFNPFFIRQMEVSNSEYRHFVNWVKDSLMMETIFMNYPNFDKRNRF